MKRYFGLMLTLLLSSTTILKAQQVNLGIEAGPNFSVLTGTSSTDFESRMANGTHIGVYLRYTPSLKWSFWGGPAFSENNFDRTYRSASLTNNFDEALPEEIDLFYSFKMVELPLGVMYTISGEYLDISVQSAVRGVITSGHDGEFYSQRISENNFIQFEIDLENQFKKIGLLAEAGLQASYALDESTRIFASAGYAIDVFGLYDSAEESKRLQRIDLSAGLSIAIF
ncbi:MAG: hypothetical protein RI564_02910 [Gracilimonas sp.]|nr:hypothetical protein [Gracilimonas sp.]